MKARKFAVLLAVAVVLLAAATLLISCDEGMDGDEGGVTVSVTCYLNGTTEAPVTYEAVDGVLSLPSIPARTGYTFNGLFDAPSGGSMVMDASGNCMVVFDHAMTVYAQWTAQSCYIVFDGQGGEVAEDEAEMTVTYGTTVTRFPTATREGYTFVGWEDADGNRYTNGASVNREKQTFNSDNYVLDGDTVRLFATYEIAKYTVVFDYNDGTYRTADIIVEHGKPISEEQYPAEGLDSGSSRVIGWALSADGVQPFMGTVKSNMTLYAIWKDYRIFTLNDAVGNQKSVYVYRDEAFNLLSYDGVIRPGYQLDGWYTSVLYAGNPVTEIRYESTDKIYYAKWSVATYSLVFDQNSAGKTIAPITYQMGDSISLEIIYREGLTFRGWSSVADGSGEVFTTLPATLWGDHTLYAIYDPAYFDVTLWSDGGVLPSGKGVITVEYTKAYEYPVPQKTGFVFLGWFDSAEPTANRLTTEQGASLVPYSIIGDSTAYAHWTPVTYTVTFHTNGGSSIAPVTVDHGNKLTIPADPTLKGRIFTGWYTDSELTERVPVDLRVTSDIALYAGWIISNPISTAEELKLIATNPDANYHLTNDINLGGAEWTPVSEYRGILDGKGFKIHNFTISASGVTGFIVTNTGTVQNLTLSDFNIVVSGACQAGAVTGNNNGGAIRNCTVTDGMMTLNNSVSNYGGGSSYNQSGGICGNNAGVVDGCTVEITIAANVSARNSRDSWSSERFSYTFYVGGIAGRSTGVLKNSTSSCTITTTANATVAGALAYVDCIVWAGGVVGWNDASGSCENCLSRGKITIGQSARGSNSATYAYVGGFVGSNSGTINACASYGTVEENAHTGPQIYNLSGVGGFVGINYNTITNCYSCADTLIHSSTSQNGGFVFQNRSAITNCYAAGTVKSEVSGVILAGFVAQNASGGNINKCFAAGNMVGASTANTGSFVVTSDTGSSCFKHYYSAEMTVTVNGIPASPAILEGEIVSSDDIKTEAFLYDTLAWSADIWRIPTDGYPVLVWQD